MSKKDKKSIIASGKLEDELLALKLGVERSDQAIFITDKEGVILYVNPAFEEVYGFTSEEVLGEQPRILKSGKESNDVYKNFWDDLLGKKIVNIEIINKTKNGKLVDIQSTANPIVDKNGDIIGFLAIQSDITERKKLRHKLMEAEAKYRDIVENSPDMIHSVDKDGRIIFTNKRECELLGYSKEELVGKHIHDIYTTSQRKEIDEGFEKLKKEGKLYVPKGKMVKKNGEELDVEIDSITVKDEKGDFIRTRSIIRDLSLQKAAEESIEKGQERYKMLFQSSRDAIMTLEPPSWKFTSGNPTTVEMFACKDEKDFVSRGPWEYSPEKQPDGKPSLDKAKEMIMKAMDEGSNFFEWDHMRLGGEVFPATVLLTRMTVEGNTFLQATVRDITEQKKSQEELTKKIEQMEFMGRVNLKRYKKMIDMQKEIIDLKKRLGENPPNMKDIEEYCPECD